MFSTQASTTAKLAVKAATAAISYRENILMTAIADGMLKQDEQAETTMRMEIVQQERCPGTFCVMGDCNVTLGEGLLGDMANGDANALLTAHFFTNLVANEKVYTAALEMVLSKRIGPVTITIRDGFNGHGMRHVAAVTCTIDWSLSLALNQNEEENKDVANAY